jgi:hypothetical protein
MPPHPGRCGWAGVIAGEDGWRGDTGLCDGRAGAE